MVSHPCQYLRRVSLAAFSTMVLLPACRDVMGPLPKVGAPDTFQFSMSAIGSDGFQHWRPAGDTLTYRSSSATGILENRVVPSPEAWRAFWVAVDDAGLVRWRASYSANVLDGIGWSLNIGAGARQIESAGYNAYPDDNGTEHELEMTAAFRDFLAALEYLADVK